MIKAIIFDWHGVLDFASLPTFIKYITDRTNATEKEIKNAIKKPDGLRIVGKIDQEIFINEVEKRLNADPKVIRKAVEFVDTVHLNKDVWEIVKKLSGKYKLAVLSDSSTAKTAEIRKLQELNLFDVKIFSSEEGMYKIDPEFFFKVSKALNENPENCLFIEDNPKNIERAKKLGFETYLFTTALDLSKYLKENHLL